LLGGKRVHAKQPAEKVKAEQQAFETQPSVHGSNHGAPYHQQEQQRRATLSDTVIDFVGSAFSKQPSPRHQQQQQQPEHKERSTPSSPSTPFKTSNSSKPSSAHAQVAPAPAPRDDAPTPAPHVLHSGAVQPAGAVADRQLCRSGDSSSSSTNLPSVPVSASSSSSSVLPSSGAAPSPRLPLSAVVSALVGEWSRSYTVEALKGDVESMCMLAQGHFSRNGWGCIPRDVERGHDWLARAKQAVLVQAAEEAKRHGRPLCSRTSSAMKEKAAALEQDVIHENVFSPFTLECGGGDDDDVNALPLDDHLSSGSLASLDAASFSCDMEGGTLTSSTAMLEGVQLPTDTDGSLSLAGCATGRDSVVSLEAEGEGRYHAWPPAATAAMPPCERFAFASPTARTSSVSLPGSVRNSVSHPNLSAEFSKARALSISPAPVQAHPPHSHAHHVRGHTIGSPITLHAHLHAHALSPAAPAAAGMHKDTLYEDEDDEEQQQPQQQQPLSSDLPPLASKPRHSSSAPTSPLVSAQGVPSAPMSELEDSEYSACSSRRPSDAQSQSSSSTAALSSHPSSAGSSLVGSRTPSEVNSPLLPLSQAHRQRRQPHEHEQHTLVLHASAEQAAQDAAKDKDNKAAAAAAEEEEDSCEASVQHPPLRRANSSNN